MFDVVEHPSGIVLSVKTFRPLMIFPWHCSIWRQQPFRTAIATVAFRNKSVAVAGHNQVVDLLRELEIAPDMKNIFTAVENYAKQHLQKGVKSYRVYSGHELEGKISVSVDESSPPQAY